MNGICYVRAKETATVIGKPGSTIRGIQMRALATLTELLGGLPL